MIENLPGQWSLFRMVIIEFLCRSLNSFSALRMLIELCSPVDLELIEMSQALNRIVGEEVIATVALPPFPASIKDGYAVHSADGAGTRRVRAAVIAGSSNSALSGQFSVIE